MEKKIRVLVSGRVQGIGYRVFVDYHAKKLGLKGYVKNLPNGKVEAALQGDSGAVKKMLEIMKKEHPLAVVNEFKVENIEEDFDEFKIEY